MGLPEEIMYAIYLGKEFAKYDYFSLTPTFHNIEELVSRKLNGEFVHDVSIPHINRIRVALDSKEVRRKIGMPLDYYPSIQKEIVFFGGYQKELASIWDNPENYDSPNHVESFRQDYLNEARGNMERE